MREAIAAGRSELHFDQELARLRAKDVAELTTADAAWFADEVGLGVSTDHLVPLSEAIEPPTEPVWLRNAKARFPDMGR